MDDPRTLDADRLPAQEIEELKELERRNRDLGAREHTAGQYYGKRAFQLHAESRTYLRYLAPRAGERVLDAGAGLGRLALLVAPRVGRLVCVDLSADALEVLRAETEAQGIRNVETVQGDLCRVPGTLGPFDRAYSVEVLQHIPSDRERRAALAKMHELLKPGGRCLIGVICWNRRTRRRGAGKESFWGTGERRLYAYAFTPQEIGRLLRETGFLDVRVRGLMALPARITRRLPRWLGVVETWCSTAPFLARVSNFVIATGRRGSA